MLYYICNIDHIDKKKTKEKKIEKFPETIIIRYSTYSNLNNIMKFNLFYDYIYCYRIIFAIFLTFKVIQKY